MTAFVQQLDGQLADIQEKIAQYNTMITEKEEQIEETGRELEAAIVQQDEQYAAMKKRIQFMYERGDSFLSGNASGRRKLCRYGQQS